MYHPYQKVIESWSLSQKITNILDPKFLTERESLVVDIEELESQLTTLNRELQELEGIPTLSSEFLENYSKLTATINALKEQNEVYLKESSLSK